MAQNSLKTSATIVPTDQLLLSSAADGHRAAGRQVMKYFQFYIFCNVSVSSKKDKATYVDSVFIFAMSVLGPCKRTV